MAIKRLEVSNPAYTPQNTQLVTVHSSHLGRRHDLSLYNVNAQGEDIPIIILMHGVYGNHWVWMHLAGIDQVYERLKAECGLGEFILVMPSDGGLNDGSAYLPTLQHGNYEQWIMDDVLAAVIQTVPSASERSRLYLSGLSMGGYGALRLGIKYAARVAAISAHSSIIKLEELAMFTEMDKPAYHCENPQEADILYWVKQRLADTQPCLPPLRFDCGRDDELFTANVAFSHALHALGLPHQFEAFAGGHAWEYWQQHVVESFLFFQRQEATHQVSS